MIYCENVNQSTVYDYNFSNVSIQSADGKAVAYFSVTARAKPAPVYVTSNNNGVSENTDLLSPEAITGIINPYYPGYINDGRVIALSINKASTETIVVGDTFSINASVVPSNANNQKINLTLSNFDGALQFVGFNYIAAKPGKAIFYFTTINGIKKNCTVIVLPKGSKLPQSPESKLIKMISDGDGDDEDIEYIVKLERASEELYRQIFFKYLGKFKFHFKSIFGPAFSPPLNILLMDSSTSRYTTLDDAGSYFTFFHEYGHGVDYNSWPLLGCSSNDYKDWSAGKTLWGCLQEDVYGELEQELQTLTSDSGQITRIINAIKNKTIDKITGSDKSVLTSLKANMYEKIKGSVHGAVSDVYGGMTNNFIVGDKAHDDGYWYSLGIRTSNQEKEFWASYFAGKMICSFEESEIRRFFPRSSYFVETQLAPSILQSG